MNINNPEVTRPPVVAHTCDAQPAWIKVYGTSIRDTSAGNLALIADARYCPWCGCDLVAPE